MTTTAADLVAETRRHLRHGERPQVNKLAAAVATTTATSITLTYDLGPITDGSTLSIGLERMYVWAVDSTTKVATVERGWDGSTASTHADDSIVRVNEHFDDFAIVRALNADLADLSSPVNGLFKTTSVDRTYSASTYGYNLDADIIGEPIAVLVENLGGTANWTRLAPAEWVFDASADTTDFSSGTSLRIIGSVEPGRTIRVVYREPFVDIESLIDDMQDDIGLPASANDIPPLGAAVALLSGRPARRSQLDTQGSTRRAEEVSTNDTLQSVRALLARREQRVAAEAARISANYASLIA